MRERGDERIWAEKPQDINNGYNLPPEGIRSDFYLPLKIFSLLFSHFYLRSIGYFYV